MSTITQEQEQAIREWLAAHPTLAVGVGTEEQACSVAAINLALTGTLTDAIPYCMSEVIGQWIIRVQDEMPEDIRDSAAWRDLLPLAAGTGRAHELERLALVVDWMWTTALPLVQPVADARGFGFAWGAMCEQRTPVAAAACAAKAAKAAVDAYDAAAYAACAAYDADADAAAAAAANAAAAAANAAACDADADSAWRTLDPVGLLRRLIAVTDARAGGA